MTDSRTPDETRMRRVYRPAPASRPARSEERALSEQFLAVSEEFDESVLLADLEPADRDLVERRVHEETMAGIVALRWVSLAIVLLLVSLDVLRWREGAFDLRWPDAYVSLATVGAHLLIAIGVMLSFRIAELRRHDPSAQVRGTALVHMGLVCVALLVMALAALGLRDSTFGFVIAVMVGNLVYHLPRSGRLAFNGMAALIALAAILNGAGASPAGNLLRFAEVTTALVLTVLAGNLVRRQRVRAVIVELRLSSMALVDGLTGVASRRRVEEIAEGELAMSAPDRPLSIILLDLDDFKLVNDTHGHNAGDEVLRGIARLLQQRGRLNDTVGRWGGEEFLMVLPDTPATGALELAEALRGRISRQLFEGIGRCTASFGVAESRAGDTLIDLIARADGALYDAKRAGRNRVREAIPPELTARQGSAPSGAV